MLGMIKAEFRHIRHNRLLLLSTVVICFIPFLYSIFFLKSVWDPYGTTQNLPVAVVNHDQPVKYQGKRFAVGQQMTDELKKNHQLKWEIVSQKQANYGLKHREYYTVVTIPKDFSKDATTVLDHQPTKMKLTYTTNDSLNMIAEVISRMGMSQLNQQIRGQVTKAYAKTMFSMVKKVKGGMVEAANGAGQLDQGMATLSDGLNQYVAGVSQVNNGVQTLRASVMPLGPAAAKLAAGSSQLAMGAQTYTAGVGKAAAGAGQLHQGIGQYTAGVQQLGNGLQQINGQSAKLKAGANQLATGSDQLSQGTKALNDRVTTANGQLKGQLAGLNTSLAQAQALQQQLPAVANGMQQMQAGMGNVKSALAAVNQAASALQSAPSGGSNTAATDQQIAGQLSALAGSTTDDKIKGQLSALAAQASANAQNAGGKTNNAAAVQNLQAQIANLNQQVAQLGQGANSVAQAQAMLGQVQQLMSTLKTAQGNLQAMPGQLSALQAATGQLATGAQQLQGGIKTAQGGINQYTNAVGTAANGANQLTQNSNALLAGSQQLLGGLQLLNANSGSLVGGAMTLAGALGQLNQQVPALIGGINQLAAGTAKLDANSPALLAGVAKLQAGANQLATALSQATMKLNQIQLGDANADMIAKPTKLQHKNYTYVRNYGHALAPYVLSVALYVGALVFNFVYPIRKIALPSKSGSAWWASKVVLGLCVITAMAVLEGGIMMMLGLHIDHVPSFFTTLILFGWASMAIVMFLSMLLDNPGRFLSMVLLMLQLGGSGGTFPMELTKPFYNDIHWYLPMTYSIQGLRQGMFGGLGNHYAAMCNSVLLGLAVVFNLLLLFTMIWLQGHNYAGKSQLDGNQDFLAIEQDDDGMHLRTK